ncbi:MAG: TMEM165/GDT1 family protein [Candidatus Hodarchaeales archaeon]|jgi:putative Ca2+/H+ antiporter (TMEM165/GDT1 family)
MFVETFLISFGAILLLEFGDKTQLIVLALTTKYKERKLAILMGFFSAIFIVSVIGVVLGNIIKEIIPESLLKYIGALLFIFVGIYAFYDYYKDRNESEEENTSEEESILKFPNSIRIVLLQTFGAIFLVEMGDKSQIFVITLATQYSDLFAIALGATLAMTFLAIIAILVGDLIIKIVPEAIIKLFSAILFILIGLLILIF